MDSEPNELASTKKRLPVQELQAKIRESDKTPNPSDEQKSKNHEEIAAEIENETGVNIYSIQF